MIKVIINCTPGFVTYDNDYYDTNKSLGYNTFISDLLNDSIINLYTYGYHIKDWLKKENYTDVENFINNNHELKVCADLCNGSKHKILMSIRSNKDPA